MDPEARANAAPRKRPSLLKQCINRFKGSIKISSVVFSIINLAMIIVGAVKIHQCPAEPKIPVFLIAEGVIGLISRLAGLLKQRFKGCIEPATLLTAMMTVELVVLIYGSYWVYKEFKPEYDPTVSPQYCDKTVYVFAITFISIIYIFIFLFAIGILCFILAILSCERLVKHLKLEEDEEETNQTSLSTTGTQTAQTKTQP